MFSLYTLKHKVGWERFYRSLPGSQQIVKANNPSFQLFPWVILIEVKSEVMLGK